MLISDVIYIIISNNYQVKDNEYKWYNYSDDRAELLMELGDIIFENLVEELVQENILN